MERDLTEQVVFTLTDSAILKTLSRGLRDFSAKWFLETRFRRVKTLLNGTWFEHPLHPVITDVPIGAWTVAMTLDIADAATGESNFGKASALTTGLGVSAASGAIVTGLMDFADTDPPDTTVGFTHGVINIVATTMFALSFLLRWRNGWKTNRSAFALSGLGVPDGQSGGLHRRLPRFPTWRHGQ